MSDTYRTMFRKNLEVERTIKVAIMALIVPRCVWSFRIDVT